LLFAVAAAVVVLAASAILLSAAAAVAAAARCWQKLFGRPWCFLLLLLLPLSAVAAALGR